MKKKIILLVLWRRVISDLLIREIRKRDDLDAIGIYALSEARSNAIALQPAVALVEIPEKHGKPALDALKVCGEIKEVSPGCKVVLLCPEVDDKSVQACIDAIRQGEIDDFLFYDSTTDYLVAKIEALCP
jgi:DNA-binding NarL/FixJ family response regulator